MILENKAYKTADMLLLSFKTTPGYMLFYAIRSLISALIPTANIFVTAWFINSAINVVKNHSDIGTVTVPIILLTLIMVYNVFITRLFGFFDLKNTHKFRIRINTEIIGKRAKLKYHCMEDRKTLDLINRVTANPGDSIREMYILLVDLIQLVLSTLGVIITIFTQVWLVGVLFVVILVPIILLSIRSGKATYEASRDMSEIDRKAGALSGVMLSREASEERTLFGYSIELGKRFDSAFEYSRRYRLKVDFKYYFKQKIGSVICTVLAIAAAAAMLPSVIHGVLDISMFIALVVATLDLTGRFSWLNEMLSNLTQKREYLRDLTEFVALPEEEGACDLPKPISAFKTIEFKNVSFKYPGTDKLILDKLSLTIQAGKSYSFVGVNGAGKTTVIKLLTGLYTNYDGEILIDGKSLKHMSSDEKKGLSTVVYQDFSKYAVSLRDNIALGDASQMDEPETIIKINSVIRDVHLEQALHALPQGLDTPIGKVFTGGVDLSGGEWQRVAMARAMMSPAPLCILDEPTASLDPKSESQLYEHFRDISHNRTTLFISHRLGSTKFADIIFVLDSGCIKESGDHFTLMQYNGLYAEMFRSQAAWYVDEALINTNCTGEPVNVK